MGDLIGVVAYATQFVEQSWVHRLMGARDLNRAIADEPLAEARD